MMRTTSACSDANSGTDGAIFSAMVAPLVAKGFEVGVLEVINKLDGTPFNEDDLFLLNSIAETAASALNNAGMLQAGTQGRDPRDPGQGERRNHFYP